MTIGSPVMFSLGLAAVTSGAYITLVACCSCVDGPVELEVHAPESLESRTFPVGEAARVEFRIRNTSCVPLRLPKLETDCGCTAGLLSTESIARGAEASVWLVHKARTTSGPFGVAATLYYQAVDEDSPRKLTLSGRGIFESQN